LKAPNPRISLCWPPRDHASTGALTTPSTLFIHLLQPPKIKRIVPYSQAARAGVEPLWDIVAVNGVPITSSASFEQAIRDAKSGLLLLHVDFNLPASLQGQERTTSRSNARANAARWLETAEDRWGAVPSRVENNAIGDETEKLEDAAKGLMAAPTKREARQAWQEAFESALKHHVPTVKDLEHNYSATRPPQPILSVFKVIYPGTEPEYRGDGRLITYAWEVWCDDPEHLNLNAGLALSLVVEAITSGTESTRIHQFIEAGGVSALLDVLACADKWTKNQPGTTSKSLDARFKGKKKTAGITHTDAVLILKFM
jgi:hypothetical protein